MYKYSSNRTAIIGSLAAYFTKRFGDFNTSFALKYLGENYKSSNFNAEGTNFSAM